MKKPLVNAAFIDGINLHLTFEYLEWKLDYRKLRTYLEKRHNVTTAYYFIGFIEKNNDIYTDLEEYGYCLKFREVSENRVDAVVCPHCHKIVEPEKDKIKCDCDADLVLWAMDDIGQYDKAILISNDGDFDNLVKKLLNIGKLKLVLAPCKGGCSKLLKRASQGRIDFLDNHRDILEKI